MSLVNKESIRMDIEGRIEKYNLGIKGQIDFIYKEGKYQIEGNLKLDYNTNEIDIRIVVIEENIYLSLLGQTIQVNQNNIGTLIEEIVKSLEIELPKIEIKLTKEEIKEILESIQITEEQISADLSQLGLGKIQLQLTMNNHLEGKITSDLIEMKIGISKTEEKEIEVPEVTINEQGIKQIVEYVKELQKIIKNKYITIEVLGIYEGIQISGEIYIDFRTEVKAEANLIITYEKEKIKVNIKYLQNTIYISYKNINIKASIEELQGLIGPYLSASKEMDITIEKMINIIQGFNINSTGIELRLNLEEILQGIGETIVQFSKTEVGFDVDMNLYDLHMSIDTTKEKDIEVEESKYSSIKGYSKVIEYIMSLVNKESIRMDFEGTYEYNQVRIQVIGSIDFVLNTITKQYDIISYLSIVGNGITIHLEIRVVNQKIFITLYDNIICLNINEFSNFINEVLLKFDMQPSLPNLKDNAVSQIISILNSLWIKENGIEVDLSTLISSMSMLVIEYVLNENSLCIGAAVENLKLNISIGKSSVTMVEEQTPTLEKEDLLSIIEQVAYIVQLYQTGAVHIELGSSLIEVQLKDKKETILLAGNVDILFDTNTFLMQGNLVVDGFGVNSDVEFILSKDKIYITISNQTIVLAWNEIDQLINEALEILNPILNQNTLSIPEFNIGEFDFGDLNLVLNSNSLQLSLESLIGKLCNIGLCFHLTQTEDNVIKGLELIVNGNYDNISLHMPVTITNSFVDIIRIPTVNLITRQDLLEILKYAVELYHVAMQKEFNLEINTSLSKNGEQIAVIEGMLSIRILDNNEFDARLKAIIREYKLGEAVAWHQLDVNVISLTTMNLLDSSIGHAMMYATYGNNESDQNAVIKISSTYTGIVDLIESIVNLMNINVPALTDLEKTNVNLSNILEYLYVSKTSLSVGVNLKDLYQAMQDENQILHFELNRDLEGNLSNINASNVYLSYTNENQFMTLDQVSIEFKDTGLNVEIPSDKESYYDLSHISNLFEALYNNALEKNFEITGTVTLTAMSIVNINVPITIKVNVDEKGSPIVYAHLDMGNLGLGSMMMSKKQIYIYYKDEYVYIHRDDSKDKDDRKLKIHYSEFFNNLVYYLMDYAMGLPESIISLINKTPEGDGFIDASQCVNNVQIGTDLFDFNLNLKEIADNNDLGNLEVSLASTLVAKTDEFGNYVYDEFGNLVYVPMIYNIPRFKFVCVNVINLNSSSLTLSNIQKDELGNLVVKDVSMSELDQFVSDFDQQFNADEEYIYSNGQWVSNGKLKHNVVFDMGLSGSKIRKYAEGEKIDFPYLAGEILSIETEKGLKYYKVMDWYYDSSYLKPVQNINSMYMSNKSLVYYAKVKDITINVQINSSFDDVYELVTYEGFDFTSDIEEIYNIKNVNNSIYKFNGLKDETDSFVDVNSLKAGSYQFFVDWEEIHYDFYVVYGNQEYKLDQTDTSLFLDQDYVIERNSRYYLYHAAKLTPKYILESFANSFILCEDKQRLELQIFALNDEMFAQYEKITFEIAREEFNNKGYYGFFVEQQEELDLTTLLPNGVYDSFEINAWISDSGKYYSLDELKSLNEEYQFTAYIATKQSCFGFEIVESGARISLYSGTSSTLIFPEYAYVGSAWVSVVSIKELSETSSSPFTANTTIQDLIFNESLAYIPSNAFKNCDGLVNVYFPNALQAEQVSKDAFYFVKEGSMNFEKARDLAKKIRFHCSEIQAEQLDLLACKYNNSDRHYGKNEAGFLGTGRADLRESFVKENVNILEVSNQFIKNL
ncbi:MAG: leucine-rich repeat domain-containing protein [Anaeroplasmataceae bacterium]|nr:leucine-rich repeat domain-containing protein [Anaeroplasmataceae bacterium]